MRERVLFANISYCFNGKQQGNFRYVVETGDAMEKYNFEPVFFKGEEVCLGFFEPGFTKGGYEFGKQRQVHIEKIDEIFRNSFSASGVTVIWCAFIEEISRPSIVGWYKDAEVFRGQNRYKFGEFFSRGIEKFGYLYNVKAKKHNCVSLPFQEIIKQDWKAPRKNTNGYGFGQSNMWYAKEQEAQTYLQEVLKKIEYYSGENQLSKTKFET